MGPTKTGAVRWTKRTRNGHAEIAQLLRSYVSPPRATPDVPANDRVGALCDMRRIDFNGVRAFTPDAIRLGLKTTPDFLEISHPFAPLAPFLSAIEARMRIGYLHAGFPDVKIAVRRDESGGRITVDVEEGPWYLCGPVKVTGAQKMSVGPIIERLTTPTVRTQSVQSALRFLDNASPIKPLDESSLNDAARLASLWVRDQPAHFSEFALQPQASGLQRLAAGQPLRT
jgi:hypothetical protein